VNLSAYELGPQVEWPMGALHPELVQASLLPLRPTPPARPMDGALSAYELWPAYGLAYRPSRRRRAWPLYGLGAEEPAPTTSAPAEPARQAGPIGKGLFIGTAYGIAIGMIASEFVMRKADAGQQLKQNHQLVMFGALFGAAVGAFGAVQA
jgi:hypothetical protein